MGLNLSISASFGFAVYPENAQDVTGLLAIADQAMFAVKATGKDAIASDVDKKHVKSTPSPCKGFITRQ